jgi:hypothetical protein
MKRKRIKYVPDMPHRLYTFFISYSDVGPPSFDKFARSVGATLADVEAWRSHGEFDRAYRECSEIRRDYLIDSALCKRFDSSFTRFLISEEYPREENASSEELTFKLEVSE